MQPWLLGSWPLNRTTKKKQLPQFYDLTASPQVKRGEKTSPGYGYPRKWGNGGGRRNIFGFSFFWQTRARGREGAWKTVSFCASAFACQDCLKRRWEKTFFSSFSKLGNGSTAALLFFSIEPPGSHRAAKLRNFLPLHSWKNGFGSFSSRDASAAAACIFFMRLSWLTV